MLKTKVLLDNVFDDPDWEFLRPDQLQRLDIFPNLLGHNRKSEEFILVLKKSSSGNDCACGKAGLDYIETTHELKDKAQIKAAFVAYAVFDRSARNQYQLRVVYAETAAETRVRVNNLALQTEYTKHGDFWWIPMPVPKDEDDPY